MCNPDQRPHPYSRPIDNTNRLISDVLTLLEDRVDILPVEVGLFYSIPMSMFRLEVNQSIRSRSSRRLNAPWRHTVHIKWASENRFSRHLFLQATSLDLRPQESHLDTNSLCCVSCLNTSNTTDELLKFVSLTEWNIEHGFKPKKKAQVW